MNIKIITSVTSIITTAFLIFLFLQHHKDIKNIEEISSRLTNSISFENYIEKANSKYKNKKELIIIDLELKKSYENLNVVRQYAILEYFSNQLRYFMRNGDFHSSLHSSKIRINAKLNSDVYLFNTCLPEKKAFIRTESTFYKNNEKIYTSGQFTQMFNNYMSTPSETIREKEIINYSTKFFNTLTRNGKYFDPQKDAQILMDAVSKKFNITAKEYDLIYQKYQLGITGAPIFE
ncbi:hypothetical protein [Bacillus sp. 1P06AnD]|uniref:hypothetical protein n=1 Tax=Bacillus sp. 1P06AnD TaxID=3132208 RepID=UPI0039A3AC8D